jgi:hypothetical protein
MHSRQIFFSNGLVSQQNPDGTCTILGNMVNHVVRKSEQGALGSGVIVGGVKDGYLYDSRSSVAGFGVRIGYHCEGRLYRSGQPFLKSGVVVGHLSECVIDGDLSDDDRLAVWHFLVSRVF